MHMRIFALIGLASWGILPVVACNSADDQGGTGTEAALGGSGGAGGSSLQGRRLTDFGSVGGSAGATNMGTNIVRTLSGDFRSTCEFCTATASRLDCLCNGQVSTLSIPCGFVTTIGDMLVCNALPKGSYARTCRNCAFNLSDGQGRLSCECKDFTGAWQAQASPLVIPATNCAHVANYNGILACAPEQWDECEFAGGSFIQSCANCTMNCDGNPSMSCVCAPSTTAATIPPWSCASAQVANRFGALMCEYVN